ncbi:hypothetical protein [Blastococcus sp. TF02A-35]|uniref:hypothetical protein n=1 Tax=Blastococcus sp. TF02A-35 TaxID=2559612 RepID=UPI001073FCB9|nr:hypothetical protein [Blastococcus sp. TF02A_35]TFV52391.1 hypothetical protein E4P43_06770 [Blastococcus sp. TF02A_35]
MSEPPLWRQAYDAVDRAVTPRAEHLVRTPGFALGVALLRRATTVARSSAQDLTARAWHLVNLPAGSDVHRLRAQVGALDREVRRLTVALEAERRRALPARPAEPRTPEDSHADRAQPADDPRPRPARRGAQRPTGT